MIDPITGSARQFTAQDLARLMVAIGENRLELLRVETREERERLLRSIVLASIAAAFFLLASIALSAAIVVGFWSSSPVAVLFTLTGLYGAAGIWFFRRLHGLLRDQRTFAASLDQFQKDACPFGREPLGNPSEPRKQALIAESERNRIQLARKMEALRAEVSTQTDRAKSFGSIASSAVELTSSLAAFRRSKPDGTGAKLSWLPAILKGAGMVSTLYLAFRSRGHNQHITANHVSKL